MKRRTFIKLTAGAATAGAAAIVLNSEWLFKSTITSPAHAMTIPQNPKQVFSKCGACSNALFTLLNREFGHPKNIEELASDPLAGGLMNTQHQCGMLWGSTLATGSESFRRFNDQSQATAIATAMTGAQNLVESYSNRTKSVNCRDVIGVDFSKNSDIAEFMLKSLPGGFANMVCMNLAAKWTPEAIQAAKSSLSDRRTDLSHPPVSCASEVARKMGVSDEEMVMVAGFAGGIGLSGNACGALGAAIWLNTVAWCRENPGKSGYLNPHSNDILTAFYDATDSEILCTKISGRRFKTIEEHTDYITNGGCADLIDMLAKS